MNHILYILNSLAKLILIIIPLQLLGYIVVGIALLFFIRDKRIASNQLASQRLPKLLSLWDNGDEFDRQYGLNGDLGFQSKFLLNSDEALRPGLLVNAIIMIYDREMEKKGNPVPWYKIYAMRYVWLALRNPVNTLKHRFLAKHRSDITGINVIRNEPDDGNHNTEIGDWTASGWRYTELQCNDGTTAREYYLIKILPEWLWTKEKVKCIRIRIGYKLGHKGKLDGRQYIPFVFVVQPYKTFIGKLDI